MPRISKAERELALVVATIRKLSAKQPQKGSGLHQLVADIFNALKEDDSHLGVGKLPQEVKTLVFSKASETWATLELAQKTDLLIKHRRSAIAKAEGIAQEITNLEDKLSLLATLVREEADKVQPMVLRECCLPGQYLDLFEELCASDDFCAASHITPLRKKALETPPCDCTEHCQAVTP